MNFLDLDALNLTEALVFALPAAFLLLLCLLWPLLPGVRRILAVVALALPFLAAAQILSLRPKNPSLVVRVDAFRAELKKEAEKSTASIGGASGRGSTDEVADDFLVRGLPAGAFVISSLGGNPNIEPGPGYTEDILVLSDGKPVAFGDGVPSMVPLQSGDKLIAEGGTEWTVQQQGTFNEKIVLGNSAGSAFPVDRRTTTLPFVKRKIELFGFVGATRKVYNLDELTESDTRTRNALLFNWRGGEPHPVSPNGAMLLMFDRKFVPGSEPSSDTKNGELANGKRLEFFRLIREERGTPPETLHRLRKIGSFAQVKVVQGDAEREYIEVLRDEPLRTRIRLTEAEATGEEEMFGFSFFDPLGFARTRPDVRFRTVPNLYESGHLDIVIPRRGDTFLTRSKYEETERQFREEFWTAGAHQMRARFDRPGAEGRTILLILIAGIATVVLTLHLTGARAWIALIGIASYLLCARVLFSCALENGYPYDDTALPLALNFAIGLPFFLTAVDIAIKRLLLLKVGSLTFYWIRFAALAAVALVVAGPAALESLGKAKALISFAPLIFATLCLFAAMMPDLLRLVRVGIVTITAGMPRPQLYAWLGAMVLLRIGLALLGWKEGIPFPGGRIALSLVFVPAYLVFFIAVVCRFMADLRKRPDALNASLIQFALLLACLFLGMLGSGFFVSDLGTYMYAIPLGIVLSGLAVALQVGILGRSGSTTDSDARTAFPFIAALHVPLLGLICLVFFARVLLFGADLAGFDLSRDLLDPQTIVTETNKLRLLQFVDPERLVGLGTDSSEVVAQDIALMENYAYRGYHGEGFLNISVVSAKSENSQNDNVASVFLLGQFGMIGGCAVVLALITLVFVAWGPKSSRRGRSRNPRYLAGGLLCLSAALMIAIPSLYMLAANLSLVPFTGKNMYFLGLNSISDLYEALALFTLMLLGLAMQLGERVPQDVPAEFGGSSSSQDWGDDFDDEDLEF